PKKKHFPIFLYIDFVRGSVPILGEKSQTLLPSPLEIFTGRENHKCAMHPTPFLSVVTLLTIVVVAKFPQASLGDHALASPGPKPLPWRRYLENGMRQTALGCLPPKTPKLKIKLS
ncbi:hypothetical protein, partial [Ancylomarina sp. 16SWW S1-10-2]|uniref:hypothetical protein n=1 Tax=Ancylomarina sp. 16SWW S1-10-2 TaxID=2499681 RepID=UPI001E3322E8